MSNKDTRIVEMQFNNRQFERGIRQSLSSINELKRSLDFSGAVKGVSALDKATKDVNMNSIANNVDYVASRFSAWSIVGITAIQNLTNAAVNAGKRIAFALTLKPLKSGFQEYETQINAVQTILANTKKEGTNIKIVNDALDELNTYADKTIYNFTEMTRNIGTFTAAGVKLDTSVAAIKGIANLAAVSGSTSMQASTAMYQLSQALAAGRVKLMDWNSVVNAGMGGAVFKDALQETAKVHGVAIDDIIKKNGSFRDSLREGWLTSEILTDTLAKFTGQLTEEQLKQKGYTDEQIEGIMELGKTANDAATKVKTMTQLMSTLAEAAQSGWSQTWRLLIGDFNEAKALFTEISDTLGALIGKSADARNKLIKGFVDLGGREDLIQSLRNTFYGLASILKPIREAFRDIFPRTTAEQLKKISTALVNFTERIKIGEETSNKLRTAFRGLFSVVDLIIEVITTLGSRVYDDLQNLGGLVEGLLDIFARFGSFLTEFTNDLKNFEVFKALRKFIMAVADKFEVFVMATLSARDAIVEFADDTGEVLEPTTSIFSRIAKASLVFARRIRSNLLMSIHTFSELRIAIAKFFKGLLVKYPLITSIGKGIAKAFTKVRDVLREAFKMDNIEQAFDILNKGLFSAMLYHLTKFSSKLGEGGLGIKGLFKDMKKGLVSWQQALKADVLQKIAIAIAILAGALIVLTSIDHSKLVASLGAISIIFVELITALNMANFAGTGAIRLFAMGQAIRNIAIAIAVLSGALFVISKIDKEDITKGLVTIGVLLAEISAFMALTNFSGLGIKAGTGLVIMGMALSVLANSVKKFGEMDADKLGQGLTAMGIILAELALFTRIAGGSKNMIAIGIGLGILSISLGNFTDAIYHLGSMDIVTLGKGLIAMAIALGLVAGAMAIMPKGMVLKSVALLIISNAIVKLSEALTALGGMSMKEIGKGLLALGGGLLVIAGAMAIIPKGGAATLLVTAVALRIFASVMKELGSLSFKELGMGLISLVAIFATLGIAAMVLSPLIPALLGLAATLAIFGVSITLVSTGILLFSVALAALTVAITAAGSSLVVAIGIIFQLIPTFLSEMAKGLIAMSIVMVEGLTDLVVAAVKTLKKVVPLLIDAVIFMLSEMLGAIHDNIGWIIETAVSIIFNFVKGLLKGVNEHIGEVIDIAGDLIVNFIDGLTDELPDIIDSAFKLIISFIQGLADAIEENHEALLDAVGDLMTAFVDAVIDWSEEVFETGVEIFKKIRDGIKDRIVDIYEAGTEIASDFIDGIKDGLADMASGLWKSAKDAVGGMVDGVEDFLGINSPSKVGKDIGGFFNEGIAEGIHNTKDGVTQSVGEFKDNVVSSVSEALKGISEEVEASGLQPEITPVVDLSDLDKIKDIAGAEIPFDVVGGQVAESSAAFESGQSASQAPNITFNQNNYSPESLSNSEIYRQTNNQISRLKGAFSG